MGISFPNPINAVKDAANHVADAGKAVVNTTVNVTEKAVDITKTAVNVTENVAVKSFQFEASMTKFTLETKPLTARKRSPKKESI